MQTQRLFNLHNLKWKILGKELYTVSMMLTGNGILLAFVIHGEVGRWQIGNTLQQDANKTESTSA